MRVSIAGEVNMKKETKEFYGLTGDPKLDEPRKRQIMRQLGSDNFDYSPGIDDGEAPRYHDDSGSEYEDYKNQEVRSMNAR